ncbi:MAG: hemerythrin domain-containing protein [Bryobacteraceae bacterium]
MLRDPSLIPLSRQHHDGLALCVLIRRGLQQDAGSGTSAELARKAVDRYDLELVNHFQLEEQILFPAMQAVLGDLPLVAQLIAEHRRLESLFVKLRSEPSATLLETMCGLLERHIRAEENELFQMAQSSLPEATLREMGAVLESKAVRVCF